MRVKGKEVRMGGRKSGEKDVQNRKREREVGGGRER